MNDDLVPVRARDCACPDTPHADDGDIVYLLPTLPMEGGLTAERQMLDVADPSDPDGTQAIKRLELIWARTFLVHGAVGWNLLDADGEPVPFDVERILRDWGFARSVADKASDLYADSVINPFLKASGVASLTGRTGGSTSRRRASTPASPAPSSPATTAALEPSIE